MRAEASFVNESKATGQLILVRTRFSIPHFNGPPPPIDARPPRDR